MRLPRSQRATCSRVIAELPETSSNSSASRYWLYPSCEREILINEPMAVEPREICGTWERGVTIPR